MRQIDKSMINHQSVKRFYNYVESTYNVKFVCINDNWVYKKAMKAIASKMNLAGNIADKFFKNVAMCIPIPIIGSRIILPYSKDDYSIPNERKVCDIVHELQHLMDSSSEGIKKWYKMYISNSTFRATMEARAYGADIEAMSMILGISGGISKAFDMDLYMLSEEDKIMFESQMHNVMKNINSAPSFSASKAFKTYFG